MLFALIWVVLGYVSAEVAGKVWKVDQINFTYGLYVVVFSLGIISFIGLILAELMYYIDKPIKRFKK